MEIRSLGYRSDLIFCRFDGEVVERDRYVIVRTPANPTFYWGNFLLFDGPPAAGNLVKWQSLFAGEIGRPPAVTHFTFGWDDVDGTTGEIQPFLDAGYVLNESVVLAATSVHPPPHVNSDIVVRPLTSDAEWKAATANKIATRDERHSLEGYTVYMTRQMDRYRRMAEAGLGRWFGAFLDNNLVADLGTFRDGTLARYQHVATHPAYRRRGICGTLVYETARWMQDQMGVETLVMIADEHYHAARIYESVGFQPREKIRGVSWWNHGSRGSA